MTKLSKCTLEELLEIQHELEMSLNSVEDQIHRRIDQQLSEKNQEDQKDFKESEKSLEEIRQYIDKFNETR